MEAITFDDIALLFIGTIAISMAVGGLITWIVYAWNDTK